MPRAVMSAVTLATTVSSVAGSVPLALDEAVAEGRVKDGGLIVRSGFGAGVTWGTALMRW